MGIFFSILAFLIIFQEMNWTKSFFLNLIVLNRVNPSDVTYEIVTPCALTQLLGRTGYSDTTSKSPHLL
jgi:hypothetical protein